MTSHSPGVVRNRVVSVVHSPGDLVSPDKGPTIKGNMADGSALRRSPSSSPAPTGDVCVKLEWRWRRWCGHSAVVVLTHVVLTCLEPKLDGMNTTLAVLCAFDVVGRLVHNGAGLCDKATDSDKNRSSFWFVWLHGGSVSISIWGVVDVLMLVAAAVVSCMLNVPWVRCAWVRVVLHLPNLPGARKILLALAAGVTQLLSLVLLMTGVIFVFAMTAHVWLAEACEGDWREERCDGADYFGTPGDAMFTMVQILTLEWAGVVRAVLLYNGYCWPLFIAFLLLCSFSMVGIITGVIVTAIMDHRATEHWINPDLPGPDPPETSSKCDDSPSHYLRRVDDVFRREDDEISESPRNRPLSSDDEDDLTSATQAQASQSQFDEAPAWADQLFRDLESRIEHIEPRTDHSSAASDQAATRFDDDVSCCTDNTVSSTTLGGPARSKDASDGVTLCSAHNKQSPPKPAAGRRKRRGSIVDAAGKADAANRARAYALARQEKPSPAIVQGTAPALEQQELEQLHYCATVRVPVRSRGCVKTDDDEKEPLSPSSRNNK